MKPAIDIEDLLVWAYRTELPKVPLVARTMADDLASGWDSVSAYGDLLAVVDGPDVRNIFGVTPDRAAIGEPHGDAVRVDVAVSSLMGLTLEVPEGWWPFGDMALPSEWGIEGEAVVANALDRVSSVGPDGARRFKGSPAWLVKKHAMMGTVPDWEAEAPVRRVMRTKTGQNAWFVKRTITGSYGAQVVVEQDGFNPTRRRPYADAYQKMELVPSPFYAACDRAEYEVWAAALTLLAGELSESLDTKRVTGPRRGMRPWEGKGQQTRILPSLLRPSTPPT